MGKRNYPTAVEKALFVLSRGYCYAPTCKNAVFDLDEDGDPCIVVEIAHICGYPNGPRYDDKLYKSGLVDHWSNLILLCKPHHDKVDGIETRKRYPVDLLRSWKEKREKGLKASLQGLGKVTPDELRDIFVGVVTDARDRILSDIEQLKSLSESTAEMVRFLVDEAYRGPVLDPDTVSALEDAARRLQLTETAPLLLESARSLQLPDHAWLVHQAGRELQLPDYAWLLYEASQSLRLPDHASLIYEASRSLQLPDYAPIMLQAADALKNLPDYATSLHDAAIKIEGLQYSLSNLDQVARQASLAASELGKQAETVNALERASENLMYQRQANSTTNRWSYFRAGMIVGAILVVALFGFFWYGNR